MCNVENIHVKVITFLRILSLKICHKTKYNYFRSAFK